VYLGPTFSVVILRIGFTEIRGTSSCPETARWVRRNEKEKENEDGKWV